MLKTDPPTSSLTTASLVVEESVPSHPNRRSSPSPHRSETAPGLQHNIVNGQPKPFKRILIFCDGTWENGVQNKRSAYTNVLRLARSVKHEDTRHPKDGPPVMQVVFYQAGIGSDKNLYAEYIEGTTGSTLGDKVEDAYAFIANNYHPGDEIHIFGFSRGAYTARMVAMFIDAIGVLSRCDMDHFASIFIKFQKLGKGDEAEDTQLRASLAPWLDRTSKGHQRASCNGTRKFTVKCLGVWDTVGSLGLPEELNIPEMLRMIPKEAYQLFGFPDNILGEHIAAAYQALAINEMRKDFICSKFIQTENAKAQGQILKQTWFTGCHADIGGGYNAHDLSDITLIWMAANINVDISLDIDYLRGLINPVAPWGAQTPHDSETGVFRLAITKIRTLPGAPDPQTHETIHRSVLEQTNISPALATLAKSIETYPELVAQLMSLEELVKDTWPYNPTSHHALKYAAAPKVGIVPGDPPSLGAQVAVGARVTVGTNTRRSWFGSMVRSISSSSSSTRHSRSVSVASTAATEVEDVEEKTLQIANTKSVTTVTTATATTRLLRVGRWGRK